MKSRFFVISDIVLKLLAGTILSALSSLLIYFLQSPALHHATILITYLGLHLATVFVLQHFARRSIVSIAAFVTLTCVVWMAPQFIYQIRPYTLYLSAFAIGVTGLIGISSAALQHQKARLRDMVLVALGYGAGILLSQPVVPYISIGLLLVFAMAWIYAHRLAFGAVIVAIACFLLSAQVYIQYSKPITFYPEQKNYEDIVLLAADTQHHRLVVTQWHDDYWFFLDQLKNMSSIDEYLFYEPMVHSAMQVAKDATNMLVLGGENGCLLREILKYQRVSSVHIAPYDSLLMKFGKENAYFIHMNKLALNDVRVRISGKAPLDFITTCNEKFDIIFIDLPDPRNVEWNQYYTLEFYAIIKSLLNENGVVITQAGSPYFATQAFYVIGQTLDGAGFHTLPLHNQILTLGEWGWHLGSLNKDAETMKNLLPGTPVADIETTWWNHNAAKLVTSWGKTYQDTLTLQINTLDNPLVYQYFLKGNWEME
jgi:predicted membrane-bound spermidine synthase